MLILTQNGTSVKVAAQPFANENALQQYISANPAAIPLSESADPRELHVLGREVPTASGLIDVLGTDVDGHPYIIETKLHKNPDKRVVLAQVLDYGAALWTATPSTEELAQRLRNGAGKRGAPDPVMDLAAFLDSDEGAAMAHLGRVCASLAEGRFTVIVLMDHLTERLKDLILFMNAKSEFRVLAVELEYYRHGKTEIAYPKLFGAEGPGPAKPAKGYGKIPPEQYLAAYGNKLGTQAVVDWEMFVNTIRTIPGVQMSHFPAGTPYLYLAGTPFGDVRLFRLADNTAEIRDLLHQAAAFANNSQMQEVRAQFRKALVSAIPGAQIGGNVGRAFIPLGAAAQHAHTIAGDIRRLEAALRSQSIDIYTAPGA